MTRLYEEGAWDAEVCKELRVSPKAFDERYKTDSLFAELVDYGRLAAKAWWLRLLREGAKGSKANFNFAYAVMKNRYGWTDKSEVQMGTKPTDQMSKAEIEEELNTKKDIIARLLDTSKTSLSKIAAADEE